MARKRPVNTASIHTREQFSAYFWSFTDRDSKRPDQCWLWNGRHTQVGYGQFAFHKIRVYAHRAAYELLRGDIAEGLVIDHLCRIPACVNPAHLEAVTPQVNNFRGESWSAKHARKLCCPNGHPYDMKYTSKAGTTSRDCKRCSLERAKRIYLASGYFKQRHRRAHWIQMRGDDRKNSVMIATTAQWSKVS